MSIDSENQVRLRVNRTEGFSISPYKTKSLTFKTPIRFKSNGERLVLMLEQVISRESIWEVVKAKDALEAYARGDYSVMPVVLRVANQVDAPLSTRPYQDTKHGTSYSRVWLCNCGSCRGGHRRRLCAYWKYRPPVAGKLSHRPRQEAN